MQCIRLWVATWVKRRPYSYRPVSGILIVPLPTLLVLTNRLRLHSAGGLDQTLLV